MKVPQRNLEVIKVNQATYNRNHEVSIKNLETQIGHFSKQFEDQLIRGFGWYTMNNPSNDSCKSIELRNIVLSIIARHMSEKNKANGVEKKNEVQREVEEEL